MAPKLGQFGPGGAESQVEKSKFLKTQTPQPLNPSTSEGFIAEQSLFRKARMNKVELFGQITNVLPV